MHSYIFLALLSLFASIFPTHQSQELVIDATTDIEKPEHSSFHVAEFDLGTLSFNETYRLNLNLVNPLEKDIAVHKKPILHCSCLDFKSEINAIPAAGAVLLDLKIRTSNKKHRSASQIKTEFSLVAPDGLTEAVKIVLKYRLAGVLAFDRRYATLEIGSDRGMGELSLPIVFTNPIDKKNLRFELSEDLSDVVCEITGNGDNQFLHILAPEQLVASGPISGDVSVVDSISNTTANIVLTVRKAEDFVLSPAVFRFRKEKSDEDEYVSTAIVRFRRNVEENEKQPVSMEFYLEGFEIKSKVVPLGNNGTVYRIKLVAVKRQKKSESRFQKKSTPRNSDEILVRIKHGAQKFRIPVSVLFMS